ncbi:tyrosine-type recombinase/integrase [Nonomuraea sp. NPDC050227]|uniref:tyrosine-type recombinase/integrase n=1 Tax=Nonomuraea sp. NPDC050227 TaxID=3364360 RepID=UPI00379EF47D
MTIGPIALIQEGNLSGVCLSSNGWEREDFAVHVWRSVRAGGDTKAPKSRRTLRLPRRRVRALVALWDHLNVRGAAPGYGQDAGLIFATRNGTMMSAGNVRREFRRVITRAGLVGADWTPREMRHSFVSLLSADGVPIESIARLIGHASGSAVTKKVYRHQIQPVIQDGATVMDRIFPGDAPERDSHSAGHRKDQKGHFPCWDVALDLGGRYWDRTSDLFGVNNAIRRSEPAPKHSSPSSGPSSASTDLNSRQRETRRSTPIPLPPLGHSLQSLQTWQVTMTVT